jgi:hypothetical protein
MNPGIDMIGHFRIFGFFFFNDLRQMTINQASCFIGSGFTIPMESGNFEVPGVVSFPIIPIVLNILNLHRPGHASIHDTPPEWD